MLKDSPQPHVPFMFGLLNTNSAESLSSTKSISVPVKSNLEVESSFISFLQKYKYYNEVVKLH